VLLLPLLRLFGRRPVGIVTLHEYAQYTGWGRLRLWPTLALAHGVICTNHRDRRSLRRSGFRARVIPLGSNVGPFRTPRRSSAQRRRAAVRLLHFGTVMPNKGWEVLLPAVRRLRAEGRDVGVQVVGSLEPDYYAYHRRVSDVIAAAGLSGQIQFTGYLSAERAAAALQDAETRVGVLPFTDGASLNRGSLIALLAHGLAVITTRPAKPLEGLRHGQHYWGVAARDPAALAEGIKRVLDDPQLAAALRAGARAAAARFAWPRIARLTRKIYAECHTNR
jgi:glycosyltransferase involved in cell wall biosynthesis